MAASSRRTSGPVIRSHSPSGRFHSSPAASTSSSAFASSTSTFSSCSSGFLHRSASPTRVNIYGAPPASSSSVRFSIDRPGSPGRSISASTRNQVMKKLSHNPLTNQKRTCMCSPMNHPGSFRCSLHKNLCNQTTSYLSNRLNARRSAMTNSLVRIGTVEGDLVKRALPALIRHPDEELKDEDGQVCATVTYISFNETLQADVEVSLIGEKIKGVYGSITAKNDMMVDPHCESFLFFKEGGLE